MSRYQLYRDTMSQLEKGMATYGNILLGALGVLGYGLYSGTEKYQTLGLVCTVFSLFGTFLDFWALEGLRSWVAMKMILSVWGRRLYFWTNLLGLFGCILLHGWSDLTLRYFYPTFVLTLWLQTPIRWGLLFRMYEDMKTHAARPNLEE